MFNIFRRKKTASEPSKIEYIIAGLGNPGPKYEATRHNAGFMAVELLSDKLGAGRIIKGKCKATYTTCEYDGKALLLMKPQTFMNLSGESIKEMAAAYNVPPENIIVIYDDIAIPAGKIRVKRSGSDGGHNGIKSIIYQMGSDNFPRIKVGVGSPDGDMKDYVLGPLSSDAYQGVKAAPDAALTIIFHGIDAAMQDFNGKSFVSE
ncbi:MAG: aminoacyl-tRNA hydrolase [Clostridiaceae bacterium]|nr:aminoacyl-tRNA hydrolase [Clostridiaceae bacterium]